MTSNTSEETEIETTDTTLTLRRTFDAPRERVWQAFTNPDELEQWFVPEGMTAEVRAHELEPGGAMSITWTDGENRIDNEGYYVEVIENELSFRVRRPKRGASSHLRISGRRGRHGSRDHPGIPGSGARRCRRGLGEHARQPAGCTLMTEVESGETSLTIRRTFDASRERVWEAWTDPEQVGAWWGPDGFTITTEEIEVRPGGSWRFVMADAEGEEYQNRIAYDEIVEPERLAYTHGSPDDPEQFQVMVTFDERDGDTTELTMEMDFPSSSELDEAVEFGAVEGAKETLDGLADHLTTGSNGGEN